MTETIAKEKIIPRHFRGYDEEFGIPDLFYRIEVKRTQAVRNGKGWKKCIGQLTEALIAFRNATFNAENEPYYQLNAGAVVEAARRFFDNLAIFNSDPHIQSIIHELHVQPYFRSSDKSKKILGYTLTHSIKLTKGGRVMAYQFPASDFLDHPQGTESVYMPREVVVVRAQIIDCTKLYKDENLNSCRLSIVGPRSNELVIEARVTESEETGPGWAVAGRLYF